MTGKMQALVYMGEERLEIQELPIPVPGPGESLVRVLSAGICGTDHSILAGTHPRAKAPLIMGHECAGELVEMRGDTASGPHQGDAVTIEPLISCGLCPACKSGNTHVCKSLKLYGIDAPGAFAEYVVVSSRSLRPLAKGIDFQLGALIEPLAVAVHSVRTAGLGIGDSVCVMGGGPIGALVALVAKHAGANPVIVCERQSFRVELARSIGLEAIDTSQMDAQKEVMERTGNEGVDVVFEAAGVPQTLIDAYKICRVRGAVIQVANPKKPIPTDLLALSFKELTIKGVRVYASGDFDRAIAIAASSGPLFRKIQSAPFSLDQGEAAFQRSRMGADVMRVLFNIP